MGTKRVRKVALFTLLFGVLLTVGFFRQLQQSQHSAPTLATLASKESPVTFMTPPNNPKLFQETFCDLQGENWWNPGEWQQRTPFFLLAGAKKSATTSLSFYLDQHSQLIMPQQKEFRSFLLSNFHQYNRTTGKICVKDTRQVMYTKDYNTNLTRNNASLLEFDATPGYVFQSTLSPKFILCAAPWVKILLILRDPVHRAWSNYNFYLSQKVALASFEEWVNRDLWLLQQVGMLNNTTDFAGSPQEYVAWDTYLRHVMEGPVGRSMYVVQIQHWYDALRAIGRDPTTELLVVRTEDLRRDPQATVNRIHEWLGVPPEPLRPERKEFMVSKYKVGDIPNETRKMLQDFYRPYNQRLYDLLGGDWQDFWEKPINTMAANPFRNVTQEFVGEKGNFDNEWYSSNEKEKLPVAKDTFAYGKPSYNATAAGEFANRWCELNGTNWYPSSNDEMWQLRAPYLLLPGAKKSGTTSLSFYLFQHPKVVKARTKELQFFMNKNFRNEFVRNDDRKTLVKEARVVYNREFRKARLQNDPSLISMDATPGYLFFSSMLPQRILCVCPWVKLLIVLRNPVNRAYSNYQYVVWRSGGKFKLSFEEFVRDDLAALKQAGFLDVEKGKTYTAEQEDEAWYKYLRLVKEGPIGRSLYIIQLRHWFQAIRDVGRNPDSQIHVVRTEDMKEDLDGEYRKIQDFLGLEHSPIQSPEPKVVNNYEPMKNETRAMLEELFAPYNKRLYDMLGGDWEGYWDPP